MTVLQIGKELVALCQQGKNLEAIEKLYSPNIESVEAVAMPNVGEVQKGIEAVKGMAIWWSSNHQVHGAEVRGPFPHGNRFAVWFKSDVTPKHTGKRMTFEEVGLYTVENGTITKAEFYYLMG